jgi:hypothetical protein
MMLRFALMLKAMERLKGSISMTSFTLALLPFDLSLFRKMKENVARVKISFSLAPMTFDLSL